MLCATTVKKQPLEVFHKKVFLKILQNSQENSCVGVLLKQLQTYNIIKKETLTQLFSCEFCKMFHNTFFTEHLPMAASNCSNPERNNSDLFDRKFPYYNLTNVCFLTVPLKNIFAKIYHSRSFHVLKKKYSSRHLLSKSTKETLEQRCEIKLY